MRGFLFGAVLGAFVTVWYVGAMPEPVNSMLNDGVCKGAEMAEQDLDMCKPEE